MRPSNRELKVLEHVCLGNVEELAAMPHIGMGTISAMLDKEWIVEATDQTYGKEGYAITELGSEIFEKYYRYLRH